MPRHWMGDPPHIGQRKGCGGPGVAEHVLRDGGIVFSYLLISNGMPYQKVPGYLAVLAVHVITCMYMPLTVTRLANTSIFRLDLFGPSPVKKPSLPVLWSFLRLVLLPLRSGSACRIEGNLFFVKVWLMKLRDLVVLPNLCV